MWRASGEPSCRSDAQTAGWSIALARIRRTGDLEPTRVLGSSAAATGVTSYRSRDGRFLSTIKSFRELFRRFTDLGLLLTQQCTKTKFPAILSRTRDPVVITFRLEIRGTLLQPTVTTDCRWQYAASCLARPASPVALYPAAFAVRYEPYVCH